MFSFSMDFIVDILLPSTDAGVAIQLVVFIGLLALMLWRFWRNPDARLLTFGLGLVVLGLMGFRALH